MGTQSNACVEEVMSINIQKNLWNNILQSQICDCKLLWLWNSLNESWYKCTAAPCTLLKYSHGGLLCQQTSLSDRGRDKDYEGSSGTDVPSSSPMTHLSPHSSFPLTQRHFSFSLAPISNFCSSEGGRSSPAEGFSDLSLHSPNYQHLIFARISQRE